MKTVWLIILISCVFATLGRGQQWQTIISVDSRIGYSTNSYLNPFLSEWNSEVESAYNFTSAIGQVFWYKNKNSISVTAGFLYEPIFNNRIDNLKGVLGLLTYDYRIANNVSLGINAGASFLKSSYSRTLTWIQPKITWFVSPFTLLRFKAGSNFRQYRGYSQTQNEYSRFDLYGLEFETWPSYRWQLTAGLYGSLNTLPSIQNGFNAKTTAGYHFRNGSSIRFKVGLQQYRFESTQTTGGGGGPPSGLPIPAPAPSTSSVKANTDRIFRLGLSGSLPVNDRFSLFANVEGVYFNSETLEAPVSDYQVSAGIRFSFAPKFKTGNKIISPDWNVKPESQELQIHYSGEGRLYLVGDFNNWGKTGIPLLEQTDNVYSAELNLAPGMYEYKIFRIQGTTEEWLKFSNDTYTADDGFGSENAILLVE